MGDKTVKKCKEVITIKVKIVVTLSHLWGSVIVIGIWKDFMGGWEYSVSWFAWLGTRVIRDPIL